MLILDTDHLSVLQWEETKAAERLYSKLDASGEDSATTIITAEEQMRGWLTAIHGSKKASEQKPFYERLGRLFGFYHEWLVLPFDDAAVAQYDLLRTRVRIASMDLKIAAITLVHGARLLSANLRDFRKVPNLVVEDWLHS